MRGDIRGSHTMLHTEFRSLEDLSEDQVDEFMKAKGIRLKSGLRGVDIARAEGQNLNSILAKDFRKRVHVRYIRRVIKEARLFGVHNAHSNIRTANIAEKKKLTLKKLTHDSASQQRLVRVVSLLLIGWIVYCQLQFLQQRSDVRSALLSAFVHSPNIAHNVTPSSLAEAETTAENSTNRVIRSSTSDTNASVSSNDSNPVVGSTNASNDLTQLRAFGISLRRNLAFEAAVRREVEEHGVGKIPIIISLVPYVQTGWGVFTMNLVSELMRSELYYPIIKPEGCAYSLNRNQVPDVVWKLHERQTAIRSHICGSGWEQIHTYAPFDVIHSINGGFNGDSGEPDALPLVWGARNMGVVFMEKARLTRAQAARAVAYDAIIAGSSWNARSLAQSIRANGGVVRVPSSDNYGDNHVLTSTARARSVEVHAVLQGVNTNIFRPPRVAKSLSSVPTTLDPTLAQKLTRPGAFVVFAGGALSFRKGHDIAVAAFAEFLRHHPNAILVTAWINLLAETRPNLQQQIEKTFGLRATDPKSMSDWLVERGIPAESHHTLGLVGHSELAAVLRLSHAAVFPNRAEGGTNLPAMEAMATGVATVLSTNTGHVDLIRMESAASVPTSSTLAGLPESIERWWISEETDDESSPREHCVPLLTQRAVDRVVHWQVSERDGKDWGESSVSEIVSALKFLHDERDRGSQIGRAAAERIARFTWTRTARRIERIAASLHEGIDLSRASLLPVREEDIRGDPSNMGGGWGRTLRPSLSEHAARRAEGNPVQRSDALVRDALEAANHGDLNQAELLFLQAMKTLERSLEGGDESSSSVARRNAAAIAITLGSVVYEPQSRLSEAEALYRRALRMQPSLPEGLNALGRVLGPQGLMTEARQTLEAAVSLRPNFPDAHFHLSNVLIMQAEFELALKHAQLALDACDSKDPRRSSFSGLLERAKRFVETSAL